MPDGSEFQIAGAATLKPCLFGVKFLFGLSANYLGTPHLTIVVFVSLVLR